MPAVVIGRTVIGVSSPAMGAFPSAGPFLLRQRHYLTFAIPSPGPRNSLDWCLHLESPLPRYPITTKMNTARLLRLQPLRTAALRQPAVRQATFRQARPFHNSRAMLRTKVCLDLDFEGGLADIFNRKRNTAVCSNRQRP